MTDLNLVQKIRERALHMALDLEGTLKFAALIVPMDDLGPEGDAITGRDAALLNAKHHLVEQATADRVLRHAALFTEFIRSGLTADDLEAELGAAGGGAR